MKMLLISIFLCPVLTFAGVSSTNCKNAGKTLLYSLQAAGNAQPPASVTLNGKAIPSGDVKLVQIGSVEKNSTQNPEQASGHPIVGPMKYIFLATLSIPNKKVIEYVLCERNTGI